MLPLFAWLTGSAVNLVGRKWLALNYWNRGHGSGSSARKLRFDGDVGQEYAGTVLVQRTEHADALFQENPDCHSQHSAWLPLRKNMQCVGGDLCQRCSKEKLSPSPIPVRAQMMGAARLRAFLYELARSLRSPIDPLWRFWRPPPVAVRKLQQPDSQCHPDQPRSGAANRSPAREVRSDAALSGDQRCRAPGALG